MTAYGTPDDLAVSWLLDAGPAVRLLTRRDVLGETRTRISDDVAADVFEDDLVRGLLAGQGPDGGFGVHPYRKWSGGFWRLVSLADLGVPGDDPRVRGLVAHVLSWLTGPTRRTRDRRVDGLTRHCASQDGLGLAAVCRLGHAGDPRAEQLARWLVEWQWPDGGWNCDVRASGRRSSCTRRMDRSMDWSPMPSTPVRRGPGSRPTLRSSFFSTIGCCRRFARVPRARCCIRRCCGCGTRRTGITACCAAWSCSRGPGPGPSPTRGRRTPATASTPGARPTAGGRLTAPGGGVARF
jgi:hypothetical protein